VICSVRVFWAGTSFFNNFIPYNNLPLSFFFFPMLCLLLFFRVFPFQYFCMSDLQCVSVRVLIR